MKGLMVVFVSLFVSAAYADLGLLNYFACSYNVSEDKEVFPIVTVGEPEYLVNAEGEEYVKYLEVSIAYKKANGKKVIALGKLSSVEYVDYPAATFKGKTNAGKSIEIVIDVDHSAKVMVDGVQQVHMKNVMCSYGLAG